MRHRIGGIGTDFYIGLGSNAPTLLDNKGKLDKIHKAVIRDAIKTFKVLGEIGGADYQFVENEFRFGYEPAYMYEDILIINLNKNKGLSSLETGRCWGAWGSNIASKTRFYKDYKYQGKFKKFVDKWHKELFSD